MKEKPTVSNHIERETYDYLNLHFNEVMGAKEDIKRSFAVLCVEESEEDVSIALGIIDPSYPTQQMEALDALYRWDSRYVIMTMCRNGLIKVVDKVSKNVIDMRNATTVKIEKDGIEAFNKMILDMDKKLEAANEG